MKSCVWKRFAMVLLFAAVILGITGIPVRADGDDSSELEELQNYIYRNTETTYILSEDLTAENMLIVPNYRKLTLKLNGHSFRRSLTNVSEDGSVIHVAEKGILIIEDTVGGGTITGGYAEKGGGIYNEGYLFIKSGTITGNHASGDGGGIYSTGTVEIGGGQIRENKASGDGGGIYSTGTVEMHGGSIAGNTAANSAGGLHVNGGTVTITDGTIKGNTATNYHGGGIYVGDSGVLNLHGGTITENTAGYQGGGILVHQNVGAVNVQAKPVVTGNSAATGSDIYLRTGKVLNVAGALKDGASLGVRLGSVYGAVTSNYSNQNGADKLGVFQNEQFYVELVLKDDEVTASPLVYLNRTWENDQIKETREKLPEEGVSTSLPDGTLQEGWYIVSGTVTKADRITISGTVNLLLMDGCELNAQKGIVVESGSTLKIWTQSDDSGKIIATGTSQAAGIGGADESSYGDIEIYGGTITATGAQYGAGIGSGDQGPGSGQGSVKIYGGKITAEGGQGSAGIGSGDDSYGTGKIIIYGGDITANGKTGGAGIGGGWHSWQGEDIEIHGGIVKAIADAGGAAIGGGFARNGSVIKITGGDVTAEGIGEYGIGIGGYNNCGTISISGGKVYAKGSYNYIYSGAGIGTASGEDMKGTVNISGGEVTAKGGSYCAGIGSGNYIYGTQNSGGDMTGKITISGGTVTAHGGIMAAGIGGGYGGNNESTITISGGYVEAVGGGPWSDLGQTAGLGAGIGGGGIFFGGGNEHSSVTICGGNGGGTIQIDGGEILATPGGIGESFKVPAAAIGHGGGYDSNYKHGNLSLKEGLAVSADGTHVSSDKRVDGCRSNAKVHVVSCDHSGAAINFTDKDAYSHAAQGKCPVCGITPSTDIAHSFDPETHTCVCGHKEYQVIVNGIQNGTARVVKNIEDKECVEYVSSGASFYVIVETNETTCRIDSTCIGEKPIAVNWTGESAGNGLFVYKFENMPEADLTINFDMSSEAPPMFTGYGLLLSDRIGIVHYLTLPYNMTRDDYPGAYVTFSGNKIDENVRYYLTDENKITDYKYGFTIMLSSIQMADKVTPTFHYMKDGEECTKQGKARTVQGYIDYVISQEEIGYDILTDREMKIAKALADYGYYAQQYLSVQNRWTIGTDYAEMTTKITDSYDYDAVNSALAAYSLTKEDLTGFSLFKFRLILDSTTDLVMTVALNDGAEPGTVTVNDVEVTPVKTGSSYDIAIKGIPATKLGVSVVVKVGDDITFEICPMMYAKAGLSNAKTGAALKDLLCAMYYFGQACIVE